MIKAAAGDFRGRFREIISDPLNLAIARVPEAGTVTDGKVVLHNGHRVPVEGPGAYYDDFSDILVLNRGVHEPLEEYVFQQVLAALPEAPAMIELGAYWGHYAMWLKQCRPDGEVHLVEPDPDRAAAGRANFAANGYHGVFREDFVGAGRFTLDGYLAEIGRDRLDILHSDIQGFEAEMLEGAARTLERRAVDRWFVSTHSQALHEACAARLEAAGYRIEVSADFDRETTSYDGFIMAARPDLPVTVAGPAPLTREAITGATPARLIESLLPRLEAARTTPGAG